MDEIPKCKACKKTAGFACIPCSNKAKAIICPRCCKCKEKKGGQ